MHQRFSIGIGTALACVLLALVLSPAARAEPPTLLSSAPMQNSRVVRLEHASKPQNLSQIVVATLSPVGGPHIDVFGGARAGARFALIGTIADPEFATGLCCGTLYELPKRIGTLPEGTLLWAGSVGQKPKVGRRMAIKIYRSQDEGRTWSYLSEIKSPNTGGLWEPPPAATVR